MVARLGVALSLASLVLSSASCKKPPPPVPTVVDAGLPVDHLATGELPAGSEKAFGFPLPLRTTVLFRTPDSVVAESAIRPEPLSNYVRAHVTPATKITAGAQTTTFDGVVLPEDPGRVLRIEVRLAPPAHSPMRTSMLIRDVTPPTPQPKVSDEEAYRKAGRAPDGRPLDPKNMF